MIFITHVKNATAAINYHSQHLAPGDYYGKDSPEMKGQWRGKGAEMLGLSGDVVSEDFGKLCHNLNPETGKQLTLRTKVNRRVLTDFTFDAPKAVTLALEMGGADGRGDERILNAFRESVRETMADMEKDVQTRVRKKKQDVDRPTGNMAYAEFIHRTTRPMEGLPDPHLHCHATVMNATFDDFENKWKAIQLGNIVRDKGYFQAAFHTRLAGKLKDLGYGIQKEGNSFTIAGITRSTVEKFSRRTAIIEAEAQRLGITDPLVKGNLGRRTRENKGNDRLSMRQLRAEWDKSLTPDERLTIRNAGNGWDRGDAPVTPDQAKNYALEHAFQNASVVSERRLQAEAMTYAVGSVNPEQVSDIAQHPEVISDMRDGQRMATTKSVLKNEVAFLETAKSGQRMYQPFCFSNRSDLNEQLDLSLLSEEQMKAALHILSSRDMVTGVVGKAGTGKTRMMRSTIDAIESGSGKKVFVFAPSSQASRGVLKKEGFAQAETLEMLLRNEKLQAQTKGQVLWIDEAGLISSKDMRRLMDVAKNGGNRVVLSGDYTQHSSVEAGDAFRLLEKEAGVRLARLTEIRRQTEPGYKKAVAAIAQGSGKAAQKGFDTLNKMGCVIEAEGAERHSMLVDDYLKAAEEGKSALIIAPTHSEGEKLTEEVRKAMNGSGLLGKEKEFKARRSMGWTESQKGDIRNYEPGLVVEFNQNVKASARNQKSFVRGEKAVVALGDSGLFLQKTDGTRGAIPVESANRFDVFQTRDICIARGDRLRITKNGKAKVTGQLKGTGVNNGDIFSVDGFTKDGDIRLEGGRVLPKDWGHMQLGYVDTSFASQGKTTDRVFISVGKESLPAANQQQWYVSASRGREMAKVYVDSKEDVRNAISRTGERLSAVELTQTKIDMTWRKRFYQSLDRNRVGRFLRQRASAVSEFWRGRGKEGISYA